MLQILNGKCNSTEYYITEKEKLFQGKEAYMRILEGGEGGLEKILNKVAEGIPIGECFHVNQGIVSGADKLTDRHIRNFDILGKKGEGIFVLSKSEIEQMNLNDDEKRLLKPFYKNSDISRYVNSKETERVLSISIEVLGIYPINFLILKNIY